VEGADAVVNLVAILAESGRQRFQAVHVDGARAIARATREAGIAPLVHVSALGASPDARAHYARSKGAGEQAVLAEHASAVILRPSLVFGPEDELFNRFAGLATVLPALPVIGGSSRFQPVYAGDVAAAIVAALDGRARPGTAYELGGPEVLTMREIMRRTLEHAGRRRLLVPLPGWLAKFKAALTKPLPMALRPFTVDQVRMLQSDNVVTEGARKEGRTLEGLGITAPVSIESVVPGYLERFQPRGQFAHYRG
jgi:NADH dehydrogenase